jgi:hypothetical protein
MDLADGPAAQSYVWLTNISNRGDLSTMPEMSAAPDKHGIIAMEIVAKQPRDVTRRGCGLLGGRGWLAGVEKTGMCVNVRIKRIKSKALKQNSNSARCETAKNVKNQRLNRCVSRRYDDFSVFNPLRPGTLFGMMRPLLGCDRTQSERSLYARSSYPISRALWSSLRPYPPWRSARLLGSQRRRAFLKTNLVPGVTAKTDGWSGYPGAPGISQDLQDVDLTGEAKAALRGFMRRSRFR